MTASATGSTWTIVVAAGTGSRFGGSIPKQFVEVAGRRIVDWSIRTAAQSSDGVVVVLPASGGFEVDRSIVDDLKKSAAIRTVPGGASRSESVRRGLEAVASDATVVLVHDAARPLASVELFARVEAAVLDGADGVVPAIPVVDTLRSIDGATVDRSSLEAVQTPQGFRYAALLAAHADDAVATDDATLVTQAGGQVVTVPGERWNLKVTDPSDELVAAALLRARAAEAEADT